MKFQDLTNLIEQDESIFKPRKIHDRKTRYDQQIRRQLQEYMKNGSDGDLDFRRAQIKSLPDGLIVNGSLWLDSSAIETLPKGLKVTGYLDLRNSKIKHIPYPPEVGSSVILYICKDLRSLPENWVLNGSLDLRHTLLTELPKGLYVKHSLHLNNTPIATIPDDIKVDQRCYIKDTPLSRSFTVKQLSRMYPGVRRWTR